MLQSPGESFHTQIRLKHKNGNWIWCETTLTNLLDKKDINALLSNFRDISEKKAIIKRIFERVNEKKKKEITRSYGNDTISKILNNTEHT